jgi:dTDP-4-amino-4,6-dideoxygalactose transaminase
VANGTIGILLALRALTRQAPKGASQVLLPSFTFPATAQAVVWNGFEPVFVDIDPDHWHLSPTALERALADRAGSVAAVLAVSAFGTPPPAEVRDTWQVLASEHPAPLLIDSAAGFGAAADDGLPVGAQGDAEVVSFHATKPLAVGEAGAIFTRRPELAEEIRRLANFGLDDRRQAVDDHGINGKLSEHGAATALAALDSLPQALAARRARASSMLAELGDEFGTQFGHARGTWQFVPVSARDGRHRQRVLSAAQGQVELRTYYEPLHQMPAFRATTHSDALTATEAIGARIISLPLAIDLTEAEVERVVTVVRGNSARSGIDRAREIR